MHVEMKFITQREDFVKSIYLLRSEDILTYKLLMHITTKEEIYEFFGTLRSFCPNRLAWL